MIIRLSEEEALFLKDMFFSHSKTTLLGVNMKAVRGQQETHILRKYVFSVFQLVGEFGAKHIHLNGNEINKCYFKWVI